MPETAEISRGYNSGAVNYLLNPLEPVIFKGKAGFFMVLFRQRLEGTNERLRQLSVIDGLAEPLSNCRSNPVHEQPIFHPKLYLSQQS